MRTLVLPSVISMVEYKAMRSMVLNDGQRLDGRDPQRFVPYGQVDYLPGAHGSAVFTRGETQC